MTDLDNTQILAGDDSLLQNSSAFETVCRKRIFSNSKKSFGFVFLFKRKLC